MKYDEKSIKVYEGLKGIRKRASMYIGELGAPAIFQILKEAVENSLDEYLAGHNNVISVKVDSKRRPQTFTVVDKGRGIPIGKHKKTGKSTLTTIMTTIHAGGKFDRDGAYTHTRGTHGLGISCTCALSDSFEVWTYRDGWYYQSFSKGKPVCDVKKVSFPSKVVKGMSASRKRGTIIRFVPDYSIINKATLQIKKLRSWLCDIANLNPKLTVELVSPTKKEKFANRKGPIGYLNSIIESKGLETIGKPFIVESKDIVVAFQWTDYDGEYILSYVNGGITDGGTHVKGLQDAVAKAFSMVSPKSKKGSWTPTDIRVGMVGFMNYFVSNPEFDSQTKTRLVNAESAKQVSSLLLDSLVSFLKKNKSMTREIINRAAEIKKAREQARQITKAAAEIKRKSRGTLLPGKLMTASDKTPPEDKELFLLEGDSAGGSAKNARDSSFQEVLPLRGKIINAAKTPLNKILASKEVQTILASIGINPKDNGNHSFRVGKILLLTDPDVDGKHIANLICTLLYTLVPEVFRKEMVYGIDAPLYLAMYKGKKYYGYSLEDIRSKVGDKTPVTRMKGWGETNYHTLREIAFDKKSRKIFKILPITRKEKVEFYKIVGDDTSKRKELLGIG